MIKTIKQTDPHFIIVDGFMIAHRAGIEISQRCPENYRDLIAKCINQGWLKPVAHVTAEEYMVMQLTH